MSEETGAPELTPTPAGQGTEITPPATGQPRDDSGRFATNQEPPAETNPWSTFEQSGLTPDKLGNPAEVAARLESYNRLSDETTRLSELERIARSSGVLPEGVALGDALNAAREAYEAEQQGQYYDDEGDMTMEGLQSFIQEQANHAVQGQLQQYQQQQAAFEMQQGLAAVQAQHGLDDGTLGMVNAQAWSLMEEAAQSGQYLAPGEAASQAYNRMKAFAEQMAANAAATQQAQAPTTPAPAQAAPGQGQQPTAKGIEGAAQRAMQALQNG